MSRSLDEVVVRDRCPVNHIQALVPVGNVRTGVIKDIVVGNSPFGLGPIDSVAVGSAVGGVDTGYLHLFSGSPTNRSTL